MLDWDDLRYFLAVARNGNLSAAARDLGVSQSTAGRRLASLESRLGVRLLHRTPDGYVLTGAGEQVLSRTERLEAEALSLEREVGGRDNQLTGLVRVTCAESVASHILAPLLARLHAEHPDIMVELIPDRRELSLAMREADISVRLTTSTQHDLTLRRIGTLGFGLYASSDYLEKHGDLDFDAGCPGHYLVTQLDDIESSEQTDWLAALASQARVSVQTSSHEAAFEATTHGAGLGCLARFRADMTPTLIRLVTPLPAPGTEIWLVAHKDNRRNARIRAVANHIMTGVSSMAARLKPAEEGTSSMMVRGAST